MKRTSITIDRDPRVPRVRWLPVIVLGTLAGAGTTAWVLSQNDSSQPPAAAPVAQGRPAPSSPPPRSAVAGTAATVAAAAPLYVAEAETDPASLFEFDAAGRLVVDEGTRSALDTLLEGMADPPTPEDLQRAEARLRAGMPATVADRAAGLLRSYAAYQQEIEGQVAPRGIPASLDEVTALFHDAEAIQMRHFDRATGQALFGAHDAVARHSMQTAFIEADAALSPRERDEQVERLQDALSDEAKALLRRGEASTQRSGPAASAPLR